jgi:hypothetical protein
VTDGCFDIAEHMWCAAAGGKRGGGDDRRKTPSPRVSRF